MAKNIIFYFTGTGNSLKIAKDVSEYLSDCQIISMMAYKNGDLLENDNIERIGFVFPVYGAGTPNIVNKFISNIKLPNSENIYFYTIVSYAVSKGVSIPIIKEKLAEKNIFLNAGFGIKMVSNWIVTYDKPKNAEDILRKAEIEIDLVKELVKNKVSNKTKNPNILKYINDFAIKIFSKKDKGYNVSEKCNGCMICYKICPAKNIEFFENRPKFKNNCEQCMSCIQFCPNEAINYKKLTQKRLRYTNPNISVNEMINNNG
jgi:ferredoxin